jgi:hypothetical protein
MICGLNFAILIRALLILSLPVRILIIGSTKLSLKKPNEFLDDCFVRFESIVSNLCSCGPLA